MANAKANIYPVQLQGAELNLNKFDAEIKQYSGFNKNNSPFIGGCLSNVFLKNEANATESSDSVYVDDEGNRYELKLTEGHPALFKNGEEVIHYYYDENYNDFAWTSKKLDLPKDTVFYDVALDGNSNLVADICIENLGTPRDSALDICRLKYTYRNLITGITQSEIIGIESPTGEGANNNYAVDSIFFDWKWSATEVSFGFKMYTRNVVNDVSYVIMEVLPLVTQGSYSLRSWVLTTNTDWLYKGFTSFYYYANSGSYIFFSNTYYSKVKFFPSNFEESAVELSFNCLFISEIADISFWNIHTYSDVFISDGKIYLLKHQGGIESYTNKRMVLVAPINYFNLDLNSNYCEVVINITADNINECLLTQEMTFSDFSIGMGIRDNAYYLRKWGCCYGLKLDDRNYWGVCDYLTSSVTLDNNEPMFKLGALCGDGVLVNNGVISGLSLPGGNILVSDWNTVADNIVIGGRSRKDFKYIIYQDTSGDYYMVSCLENKLQLKEINGLLVTNINRINNCYRLSDGKVLTFAPAWNNRAPKNNIQTFAQSVTSNNYYFASAINEYNLKDNASIILNPVPVITDKICNSDLINYNSNNSKFCIDFFAGSIDSSEFLYIGSSDIENEKYFYQGDLTDMPFPLDTNGNVQYSPSLFCETFSSFGNDVFIKQGNAAYQLMKVDSEAVMSFYLGTLVEGLEDVFVIQGQYYGIINNQIFAITFANGVVQSMTSIVSTVGLQFCGNSPYMAIFFSKTNRCLYSFTGANVLNKLQFVDKISEIKGYKYNPATQSIFLLTDIGLVISSLFGMYSLESQWNKLFVYDKGIALVNDTNITWLEYYAREGFEKQLIELETCFYGMNNQTVTINDCLYVRLFSEEHEEGSIKVTATTLSNSGRKTEQTEFKIKKSDWDKLTDSIYLRYQPKEQRGLGISFSISSPFKIASLSIGSQADAILIDKVSKGAINAPQVTSSNIKW